MRTHAQVRKPASSLRRGPLSAGSAAGPLTTPARVRQILQGTRLQTKRTSLSLSWGADDSNLKRYLDSLTSDKTIWGGAVADHYARSITQRWKSGDSLYVLTLTHKKYMILEMLDGYLSEDDQNSILDLLEFSEAAHYQELIQILTKEHRLRFDPEQLERLKAVEVRRGDKKVRSGDTFSSDLIRGTMLNLVENAGLWKSLFGLNADCINTVRNIVLPGLYADQPTALEAINKQVGIYCSLGDSRMQDAMTGVASAGYASKPKLIKFKTRLEYFDVGENTKFPLRVPDRLETSVWETIMQWTGNKEGWHIFGMSLMDGYHSVTLFVDQRPGGPFLYWADQRNITFKDTHHEKGSESGFRRYSREEFDHYIEFYTKDRWEAMRVGNAKKPGKFDFGKHLQLWKLSPAKRK